jgi:hypothetical protein
MIYYIHISLYKEVTMKPRSALSKKQRLLLSRLTKLIHQGDIMRGNLVTMARTCGNPNCKCTRGEKHVSLYIYQSKKGKPRMTYIPRDWEKNITEWTKRNQDIRDILEELSQISWDKLKNREEQGHGP